jgi:glycosyltransferase involved in cell wall biosynthesis
MLMAVMASSFLGRRPKLLFDIRGFFPEEYTDAGVWKADGITYRTVKRIEKWLMRKADGFVVLTEKARDILFPQAAENGADIKGRPVEVVPCCVDLKQRFGGHRETIRQSKRTEVGISGRLVMCHLGSLGGLYLTEEIARFLTVARELDKTTFALFLTQSSNDLIIPRLKAAGFEDNDFLVMRADPADVPGYLYASDIGLSFVKAGYATQSRSPTKIPEYLAGGVRIVANSGVGDVDDLIANYGVGVVVNDFSPETYAEAMKGLEKINILPERCIEAAAEEFDLESVGGYRYRRLYSQLTGGR